MLRDQFLLDDDVIFLNHGSFGACPRPVFEVYQAWQRELERQPVAFIGRRLNGLLAGARERLGEYLNVAPDTLAYVPNATSGLNIIARSLRLEPGDEILTTDHEYGALDMTWQHVCGKTGATYVHHPIPLPVGSPDEVVESFWSAVTPRTRAIFLSHITSPTALILPVGQICERARAAGILTVIDGAHAPGQIPLDLTALDADIYAGNCHKWLCSPKGAGFLYVRPEQQPWVESLIVSWGWRGEHTFVTRNQGQATRDPAAYLSVPAAIDFLAAHDWPAVRARCHELATEARRRIAALTDLPPISAEDTPEWSWYGQMATCAIPACDGQALHDRLWDDYRIEVPITGHDDMTGVRVSFQGYNAEADLDALIDALAVLLPDAVGERG